MKQQQLEGIVLSSIDQARAGHPVEDDRVEFKQEWPDPKKPRQFAGMANRANGSEIIYIIGANESGDIFPLQAVDPANWWAQLEACFDGTAPELMHHLNVVIGEGESVVALQFNTDRVPYVVKTEGGGSPEREVPIRDGARTRSARRDELLRMLLPQSAVPSALLLAGGVNGDVRHRQDDSDSYRLGGDVTVFLEHTGPSAVMLPSHDMSGSLDSRDRKVALHIDLWPTEGAGNPPMFGVHTRADGVISTGPGQFNCRFGVDLGTDGKELLEDTESWELKLSFGVTGSTRRVNVAGTLLKDLNFKPLQGTMGSSLSEWRLVTRVQ